MWVFWNASQFLHWKSVVKPCGIWNTIGLSVYFYLHPWFQFKLASFQRNNRGDPLHSRAACTQPCNVNTHSRAHCSPMARLWEQWGHVLIVLPWHGCVNNGGTAVWTMGHGCVQVPGCVEGHPWISSTCNVSHKMVLLILFGQILCKVRKKYTSPLIYSYLYALFYIVSGWFPITDSYCIHHLNKSLTMTTLNVVTWKDVVQQWVIIKGHWR